MKKNIILSLLFGLFLSTTMVSAQCNTFYNFKEGSSWVLDTYNRKGNKTGAVQHYIKDYTTTSDGYHAQIYMAVQNDRDKKTQEGEFGVSCKEGVTIFDMKQFIPKESLAAFGNMELTFTGDNLEWPSDLSVGMKLKDASMAVKATQGFPLNLKMEVTNREVVSQETITTQAGSFDCYKITYNMKIKSVVGMQVEVAQWVTEGIGVVKSENYNKKGKMVGYSEISQYNL